MSKVRSVFLLAAIGGVVHVAAPAAQVGRRPTFKSEVNMVALALTVTDATEKRLGGLTKDNFAVYENGKSQEISFLTEDPAPLDLAILLDTSGSMSSTLASVQHAAMQLAAALRPGDRASFAEVKRGMTSLHPLSDDVGGLERAVSATRAGGDTAIYQAIYVALKELEREAVPGEIRRQALVVLSDGDDTASLIPFDAVLEAARRSNVAIYCVSLRPPRLLPRSRTIIQLGSNAVEGDYVLRSLAEQTGGRAFFKLGPRDLARVTSGIAAELANQYSLGYVSADQRADGSFRSVTVRILGSAVSFVRTRPGYFAPGRSRP